MKYAVLGAGLMGKAIAYDLLNQPDTTEVIITDNKQNKLSEATWLLDDNRLKTHLVYAENDNEVNHVLSQVDAAVAAIHPDFNVPFSQLAIKAKTHLCDLGGSNKIVDEQMKLSEQAEQAGISIIPDCGLAPGMVSILVKWGLEKFNWAETVKIRVGGLPQTPRGILKYGRLFSIEGLLTEYIEPVRILRNGKLIEVKPLTELEEIDFPAPFGRMEAFATSGGISTLVESYQGRLKNLDYKTVRYPGHCDSFRAMHELGLFSDELMETPSGKIKPVALAAALIEQNIPLCQDDVILMKIIFEGGSKSHALTLIDYAITKPPLTAMMKTTAYPASIIAQMQAHGVIKEKGVVPQEKCVPTDKFINELRKRNIKIEGI
jgi:lysine 6-dehydrogenase